MRRDHIWRGIVIAGAIAVVASCGGHLPARLAPTPSERSGPFGSSSAAVDPIEIDVGGPFPQSIDFVGLRFTLTSAHVSNTHPYPMFSDPRPGQDLFGILAVSAENTTTGAVDYRINETTFRLRTWSGRVLSTVEPPGVRSIARLDPSERADDKIVFPLPDPESFEGAYLLVGNPPDTPAVMPVTSAVLAPSASVSLAPDRTIVQAGSVRWQIVDSRTSVEAPPGVCCPETGLRADEGELFVHLSLRATVSGSQYGQATITTDALRLVAGAEPLRPLQVDGRANVAEGASLDLTADWVVPSDVELVLQVGIDASGVQAVRLVPEEG